MAENGNRPATKSDLDSGLKGLEERLRGDLAGKADLDRLDAKVERLDRKIDRVAAGLAGVQADARRTKRDLSDLITKKSSKTQALVLEVLAEVRKIDRRHVITGHNVGKLEKRVCALEGRRGSGGASQVRQNGRRYKAGKAVLAAKSGPRKPARR